MTITSGDDVIFVKSDGAIEVKGKTGPKATLRTTGEVLHENGGLLLTLNADGTITGNNLPSDQFEGLVIGSDGTLTQAGQTIITITPEGAVIQEGEEVAQVSGPESGRRAAMLVMLLNLGEAQGDGAQPPPQ